MLRRLLREVIVFTFTISLVQANAVTALTVYAVGDSCDQTLRAHPNLVPQIASHLAPFGSAYVGVAQDLFPLLRQSGMDEREIQKIGLIAESASQWKIPFLSEVFSAYETSLKRNDLLFCVPGKDCEYRIPGMGAFLSSTRSGTLLWEIWRPAFESGKSKEEFLAEFIRSPLAAKIHPLLFLDVHGTGEHGDVADELGRSAANIFFHEMLHYYDSLEFAYWVEANLFLQSNGEKADQDFEAPYAEFQRRLETDADNPLEPFFDLYSLYTEARAYRLEAEILLKLNPRLRRGELMEGLGETALSSLTGAAPALWLARMKGGREYLENATAKDCFSERMKITRARARKLKPLPAPVQ
jgi:hypothetical protein